MAMDIEATETSTSRVGTARRIAFFVLLGLFVLMHVFFSPLPFAVLGWFLEEGAVSHRVHEIVFGFVAALSLTAVVWHIRKPERRIAETYQMLATLWLFIGATLVIDRFIDPFLLAFLVVPLLLVALHPGRSNVLRPTANLSRSLGALVLVAGVPLAVYAVTEFRAGISARAVAQPVFEEIEEEFDGESLSDEEFETISNDRLRAATTSVAEFEQAQHFGHWSAMGAFALIIVALGAIAALRPTGWRLPAWSAGLSMMVIGIASLTFPQDASSLGGPWALLAIAWGAAFIVVAQRERDRTA